MCGAVINIRAKGDKIAVWTREAENQGRACYTLGEGGIFQIGWGAEPSRGEGVRE